MAEALGQAVPPGQVRADDAFGRLVCRHLQRADDQVAHPLHGVRRQAASGFNQTFLRLREDLLFSWT